VVQQAEGVLVLKKGFLYTKRQAAVLNTKQGKKWRYTKKVPQFILI
jgi:hypothetical protein